MNKKLYKDPIFLILGALVLLFTIYYCFFQNQETIKITTFNIQRFKNYKLIDRNLEAICDKLRKFQLISIQKCANDDLVYKILTLFKKRYNQDYDVVFSEEIGEFKDKYAFLYRKKQIQFLEESGFYPGNEQILGNPFFANFKAGSFDFIIISMNISSQNDNKMLQGTINLEKIKKYIKNRYKFEDDLIFCGNLNLEQDNIRLSLNNRINLNEKFVCMTVEEEEKDFIYFDKRRTREFSGFSGIDKIKNVDLTNNYQKFVWATFNVDRIDDDGESLFE